MVSKDDISAGLNDLQSKVLATQSSIQNEEHTKMAYIVPMLKLLGFNPFDPTEVIPEYTCDFGIKRGEKVDYALSVGGDIRLILEAKDARNTLTSENVSQLYRYFSVSSAKVAVLTNGVDYMLFTDSKEPNKMDSEPYYKFSIKSYTQETVDHLYQLTKDNLLDFGNTEAQATQGYAEQIREFCLANVFQPSEAFVDWLILRNPTSDLSVSKARDIVYEVFADFPMLSCFSTDVSPKEAFATDVFETYESDIALNECEDIFADSPALLSDDFSIENEDEYEEDPFEVYIRERGEDAIIRREPQEPTRESETSSSNSSFPKDDKLVPLSDKSLADAISAGHLCGVCINGTWYSAKSARGIFASAVDYLMDRLSHTPESIINLNIGAGNLKIFTAQPVSHSISTPVTDKEYRGLYITGYPLSTSRVLHFLKVIFTAVGISLKDVQIGVLGDDSFYALQSKDIEWEDYYKVFTKGSRFMEES